MQSCREAAGSHAPRHAAPAPFGSHFANAQNALERCASCRNPGDFGCGQQVWTVRRYVKTMTREPGQAQAVSDACVFVHGAAAAAGSVQGPMCTCTWGGSGGRQCA
eukprot:350767-Chlamydomonas_euryale.AAC.4